MRLSLRNRSSSINIYEEKCSIQNADSEFIAITAKLSKTTTISDKILSEFIYLRVRLKFPLSHYVMLRTHNIAWRNFCLFFLNIIKSGRRIETQNCANSSFFHTSCPWLSEEIRKIKCSILQLLVLHQIEGMQLSVTLRFCKG